jgi:AcrR family transcriptional regulator
MSSQATTTGEVGSVRPRRADARRNYDALLAAATAAFVSDVDTPLEDIARQAGVGIGTLYRHFPNREALIQAVYQTELERLLEAALTLARELPPFEALAAWLEEFIDYVATKRGLGSALSVVVTARPELAEVTRTRLIAAMDMLVERAAASGAIRNDLRGEDLFGAMSGICAAYRQPDWQDQARRLVGLLLDGLRFGAPLA